MSAQTIVYSLISLADRAASRGRAPALALAALLLAAGCVNRDVVATTRTELAAFCDGSGPVVLADGTCTGDLARSIFQRGLCTCGLLAPTSTFQTDGFDSSVAPWVSGGGGGEVASNGNAAFNGTTQIGGDLTVAGGGIEAGDALNVTGDLSVLGTLGRPGSTVTVGADAAIGGGINVVSLQVAGTLTTPAGSSRAGTITAANDVSGPVTIAPPCSCNTFDVTGIIGRYRTSNDDSIAGLSADSLAELTGDVTRDLPCGALYFSRIQSTSEGSTTTLRATGRTAVFVAGDVNVKGPLVIELGANANLDLFVGGVLNLPASSRLGDASRPTALRIWVAGGGAFNLSGGAILAGSLYAPRGDLTSSDGRLEVYGAILVNQIANVGVLTVHQDLAIASSNNTCGQ